MGLDIRFEEVRSVICPHCGKVTGTEVVYTADSGGRDWYPLLKTIGYYVPHDQRTEENDWYGKDMVLTGEQARFVREYIKSHDIFCGQEICGLIANALADGHEVVVNADW